MRSVSFFVLSGVAHPVNKDEEAAIAAELNAPAFKKFLLEIGFI